jgi:outer membrane protein assembly factor BamB
MPLDYARWMRLACAASAAVALSALASAAARPQAGAVRTGGDWTRFGYDAARSNTGPAATGITAANVRRLVQQRVTLPGTADSSPIYLRNVPVRGRARDVFFVTTSYGKAIAIDASTGLVLWRFTPPRYTTWAGSDQITNSSPVADPSRRFVYSASPDGRIHKLSVATGREAAGWPVTITRLPAREKIGPALNYSHGLVLAATGGYIGDAPPYQGHVVAIAARSGRIVHVWNSLCSSRSGVIDPASCPESGSAIWARSGVVVQPGTHRLLVATGDGRWDGKEYWGDSVLQLSPDAGRLLHSWTPKTQRELEVGDVDLGSTAPAVLGVGLIVQSGKDGLLRLIDLARVGLGRTGGQLQTLRIGDALFSAPAVWRHTGRTWLFVSTFSRTTAYRLQDRRLRRVWGLETGATSPVAAGGLLYLNTGGGLAVLRPETGETLAVLPAGDAHWSSPIVTDGRIALPDGSANDHATTGILNIYRLSGER